MAIQLPHDSVKIAAQWLRATRDIPQWDHITPHFEEEFDCKIDPVKKQLVFNTYSDELLFLLKWTR